MFYYSRQIVYLDLLEAGHKIGNAGFLKLEETEDMLKWRMQIKGLRETDQGFFEIRDETGALVDKMLLEHGKGSYLGEFDRRTDSRGGRACGEICGIRIGLAGNRVVEGRWIKKEQGGAETEGSVTAKRREKEERRAATERRATEERRVAEEGKAAAERRAAAVGKAAEGRGAKRGEPEKSKIVAENRPDRPERALEAAELEHSRTDISDSPSQQPLPGPKLPERPVSGQWSLKQPVSENQTSGQVSRPASQEELFEDKWQQLQHMYPAVHPFGDQREYLSIAPKDFVVLSMEYQKMVHNSFLLHGYYNYRHIILGRFIVNGEERFYLGVPGVYYDREKMAAEMFGFEAFEGRTAHAEQGSFGYYMKQVKI